MDAFVRKAEREHLKAIRQQCQFVHSIRMSVMLDVTFKFMVCEKVRRVEIFAGLRPEDRAIGVAFSKNDRSISKLAKHGELFPDGHRQQGARELAEFSTAEVRLRAKLFTDATMPGRRHSAVNVRYMKAADEGFPHRLGDPLTGDFRPNLRVLRAAGAVRAGQ